MLQTDDTTYTYDSRGNRTDIDIGTDNTDLTFNIADQLTRVDFEGTSYDIYTYDNNGNCTKKEHYSGTILIYPMEAIERMKAEKNKNLVHYPHLYAPTSLRTLPYLSPYLPNSKPFIDPLKWDIMTKGNDALKEQLIKNRWLSNTYPGLYTNNTQGASNTMLSSSLIPSCLSLPYDPSSSSSSDSSSSSSPSSSTSSNPSSPSSYSSLSSPISPYSPSSPQLDPDYTTTYEYDYEDRLKKITLPNDNTIEYRYDGSGKRLEKKYTAYDGQDTNITTYRYHMAGSQITQIDIDETHNLTPIKDEELLIHLGANTQPISITWVRHNLETQQTTSSTYYYHYDIHGNVLKLTDSSGVTKATYEYDTLGNITSQTNTDSVPNPFTYRGATQAIYDDETSSSSPNPTPLYFFFSSSYKPDTGTLLQGTGAPASSNPSSSSVIELMAEATRPNAQLALHAMLASLGDKSDADSENTGSGAESSDTFSPSEGPGDGLSRAGKVTAQLSYGRSDFGQALPWFGFEVGDSHKTKIGGMEVGYTPDFIMHYYANNGDEISEDEYYAILAGRGRHVLSEWEMLTQAEKQALMDKAKEGIVEEGGTVDKDNGGKGEGVIKYKDKDGNEHTIDLKNDLEWGVWATDLGGNIHVLAYKLSGECPNFYWPNGSKYIINDPKKAVLDNTPFSFVSKWNEFLTLNKANYEYYNKANKATVVWVVGSMVNDNIRHAFKLFIPGINTEIKEPRLIHADFFDTGNDPDRWCNDKRFLARAGAVIVMDELGNFENYDYVTRELIGTGQFSGYVTIIENNKLVKNWYNKSDEKWFRFLFDEYDDSKINPPTP